MVSEQSATESSLRSEAELTKRSLELAEGDVEGLRAKVARQVSVYLCVCVLVEFREFNKLFHAAVVSEGDKILWAAESMLLWFE